MDSNKYLDLLSKALSKDLTQADLLNLFYKLGIDDLLKLLLMMGIGVKSSVLIKQQLIKGAFEEIKLKCKLPGSENFNPVPIITHDRFEDEIRRIGIQLIKLKKFKASDKDQLHKLMSLKYDLNELLRYKIRPENIEDKAGNAYEILLQIEKMITTDILNIRLKSLPTKHNKKKYTA